MRKYFQKYSHLYLVMFISAVLFTLVYGAAVLDVTYTDWLMSGGDLSQHYLGWKFFRNADWQRQIGMMNNIAYPFSESVIYTDSIPLMAILCKLIRDFLPQQFQYFGIWGLLCFVLQGLFAALLLQKYFRMENGAINRFQVIVGSMFFVLAPVMLRRVFWHTSLAAHWMILLAMLFYVYHDDWFSRLWRCMLCWGLLGMLCASVHLYFIPMCGVILLGFLTRDFIKNRGVVRVFLTLSAYICGALYVIWILGGFSSNMLGGAPGLGYYSFNLNGFFNPQGWSAFFENFSMYADGQYEGFAYLGIGLILLLAAEVVWCVYRMVFRRKQSESQRKIVMQEKWSTHIITLAIIILTILMSASHELSFGKYLILKIPLSAKIESLWAVFRASGRLVWPAVYFLMLLIICVGAKYQKKQAVYTGILVVCLMMQVLELRPQLAEKHHEFGQRVTYRSELQDSFWTSVLLGLDLNAMVFADKNELSQEALYAFADYASDRQMSVNDFYFARALNYSTETVADDFLRHPNDKTIYIFTWKSREKCKEYELHYYLADGYIIGLKTPLPTKKEYEL